MKFTGLLVLVFTLTAGLLSTRVATFARDHAGVEYSGKGELTPVTEKTDATWLAQARKDYPMSTCAISGDKLEDGDMGKSREFIYKEAGKPDQLIRFCCKDCIKDFKKEPAKYLKTITDADAKKDAKE